MNAFGLHAIYLDKRSNARIIAKLYLTGRATLADLEKANVDAFRARRAWQIQKGIEQFPQIIQELASEH